MREMSLEQIEQWMNHYYERPSPERIRDALDSLRQGGLLAETSSAFHLVVFFGLVLHKHPGQIGALITDWLPVLSQGETRTLITIVWMSDTSAARDCLAGLAATRPDLRDFISEMVAASPPIIEKMPIDDPSVLDALWAAFMATGHQRYVVRIISALDACTENSDDVDRLICEAAKWSLGDNMARHTRVATICKGQLATQPPGIRAVLEEIVAGRSA